MAGTKGKSGGPRKNSGGARPGAGRKRKAKPTESANAVAPPPSEPAKEAPDPLMDGTKREPLDFLEMVLNTPGAPLKDRIRAAIAAAQYKHTKKGDGGKKDEQAEKAKTAGTGKFGASAPPLKLVNR